MKYVVIYESADDVLTNAQRYSAAHKERLDEFHGCGTLLMARDAACSPLLHGRRQRGTLRA
jgi:hypothetical protein